MSILSRRLEERQQAGDPIRVGLVGAGFAGRGFALQTIARTPGMRLVAVANRTIDEAERAYREAGIDDVVRISNVGQLEAAIAAGRAAVCDDPEIVTSAAPIEAIVEATGTVEFGAGVAVSAIQHGKHVVLINAELDSTLGPILKVKADRAGVVLTDMAGDQPGVIADLLDEVRMLGFRPILAGNIKSLLDHRRTPDTQRGFAEATFQRPFMVTSFADGTKISAEMAVVANATGFGVAARGMLGPRATRVEEAPGLFPVEELLERPIVDYIIGAEPSFGVFVLGYDEHPLRQRYMRIYKMGEGPVYTFYRPYHFSPFETPGSVARAVLFGDPTITPMGAPVCEVVTLAKRDLRAGEVLDGIGGFTAYGSIENAATARAEDLLPMGLSDGAQLRRDIPIDGAIAFNDVDLPPGRLVDRLWAEQLGRFGSVPAGRER
ncbi:MAG: NAD(P)-dependent oxidoreductase [Chloroflexota bacterium]|nr:NAD(P)-dependent oxidoreductase [Chloroflexota bacterium]